MSSEAQHLQSAQYRRDNWWFDEASDDVVDDEPDQGLPNDRPDPNDPNEIVAHRLLIGSATLLCATTLRDTPYRSALEVGCAWLFDGDCLERDALAMHKENRPVELSEPCLRPPTETVRDQRHRKRVNDETGYISGGETTGVVIADRSLSEFIAVVNLWLESRRDLRDQEKNEARQLAYRLKKSGELRDVDVLAKVVESVR